MIMVNRPAQACANQKTPMSSAEHTREPYYLTLGYVAPLLEAVRSQGKPLDGLLALLGLSAGDLKRSDLRLSDRSVTQAFLRAAEICQDPNIGLHAGQGMNLSNIGILGHLLMTCTEMSQVMALHTRYQTLFGNGALSDYQLATEQAVLSWRRVDEAPAFCRHDYEFNLAGWASLIRNLAGQHLRPDLIEFPVPRPGNIEEQRRYFGCEIRYGGSDCMRVHFDRKLLEHALFARDATLQQALDAAARKRLQDLQGETGEDMDSVPARTRHFVRQELMHGPPPIKKAASTLGLSVRSLQRQLDAAGITYKALLDDVRQTLAERYITHADLSLIDVALMLGFSNQSSFQRAFKRWTARTPGEFRHLKGV